MKKSKKNYLVIALVVILIALAVGYAAFSTTLNITGTATANGSWDVHFENATITPTGAGNSATISQTTTVGDTLTVAAALNYPGDGKTVSVDVVNNSTVAAKLTGFTVIGEGFTAVTGGYSDGTVIVKVPTMTTNDVETTLAATNGTGTFVFTVEWIDTVNTLEETPYVATFNIQFTYAQDTTTFDGTPSWTM